jgi:hypothetical protein
MRFWESPTFGGDGLGGRHPSGDELQDLCRANTRPAVRR